MLLKLGRDVNVVPYEIYQIVHILMSEHARGRCGSLMVSALDSERAVRVQALAGDIVLCSWARHFTLTLPLSTKVYKCVPANLMLGASLQITVGHRTNVREILAFDRQKLILVGHYDRACL